METHETLQDQPVREPRLVERISDIREQLRQIPEDSFLIGAALSVGASLLLRSIKKHHDAQFVGQWAPTLLLLGLYAKRRRESRRTEYERSAEGKETSGDVH
jgi:hypothetical protein